MTSDIYVAVDEVPAEGDGKAHVVTVGSLQFSVGRGVLPGRCVVLNVLSSGLLSGCRVTVEFSEDLATMTAVALSVSGTGGVTTKHLRALSAPEVEAAARKALVPTAEVDAYLAGHEATMLNDPSEAFIPPSMRRGGGRPIALVPGGGPGSEVERVAKARLNRVRGRRTGKGGRPELDDLSLAQFARDYVKWLPRPIERLRVKYELTSRDGVTYRHGQAVIRGFLTAAPSPGKAGGLLTPKALELLRSAEH